jgi:hypothetical protein
VLLLSFLLFVVMDDDDDWFLQRRMSPIKAIPQATPTLKCILCPDKAAKPEVITTLSCVEKAARADGIYNNPTLPRACAPEFHNANSAATDKTRHVVFVIVVVSVVVSSKMVLYKT